MKLPLIALFTMYSSVLVAAPNNIPNPGELPVTFDTVFRASMQEPNILFYYGEQAYRKGDYELALTHFLEAAKYEHTAAVQNVKFMISKQLVTQKNELSAIEFLLHNSRPGVEPEPFITSILARYYQGSSCVWVSCEQETVKTGTSNDYAKSYYYHQLAAQGGDVRSAHISAMMDLLGVGTARNPSLALDKFEVMAQKGSSHAAYVAGKILQGTSGVTPNMPRAIEYLSKAASQKHPRAMMDLAEIQYRLGAQDSNESQMESGAALYEAVIDGAFASELERVEAMQSLADILNSHPKVRSKKKYLDLMNSSANASVISESVARANIALGDIHSERQLSAAVEYYTKAADVLLKLPVISQQRNADVWQKLAAVYGRGDASLDRSELMYGRHMTTYRSVMAKTPEPDMGGDGYFHGYFVFSYPGV